MGVESVGMVLRISAGLEGGMTARRHPERDTSMKRVGYAVVNRRGKVQDLYPSSARMVAWVKVFDESCPKDGPHRIEPVFMEKRHAKKPS